MENVEKPKFAHDVFTLSTDYKKLWELIASGYRIPAWVLNRRNVWDIVDVKMINGYFMIGSRGIGYNSHSNAYEDFVRDCTCCDLHFISN